MSVFDPIPSRHPKLVIWARAFRRSGYSLRRVAELFDIDAAQLVEAGVEP